MRTIVSTQTANGNWCGRRWKTWENRIKNSLPNKLPFETPGDVGEARRDPEFMRSIHNTWNVCKQTKSNFVSKTRGAVSLRDPLSTVALLIRTEKGIEGNKKKKGQLFIISTKLKTLVLQTTYCSAESIAEYLCTNPIYSQVVSLSIQNLCAAG